MDSTARLKLNAELGRLADGDRSAFESVYATLWPVVRSFCRRVLGEQDADDVAQVALLKIFDRASTFDPSRDAVTWALAIATWECRTVRKNGARRREIGVEAAQQVVDARASVETAVIDAQLRNAAIEILGGLSESDRETLRLTFEGVNPEGVASTTFRKRRERAFDRLREAWRKVYGA